MKNLRILPVDMKKVSLWCISTINLQSKLNVNVTTQLSHFIEQQLLSEIYQYVQLYSCKLREAKRQRARVKSAPLTKFCPYAHDAYHLFMAIFGVFFPFSPFFPIPIHKTSEVSGLATARSTARDTSSDNEFREETGEKST